MFELLLKIYFTPFEYVSISIHTYIRPLPESQRPDRVSPGKHQKPNLYFVAEPIFVKNLTTEYLFEKTLSALDHSYKAK